MPHETVLKRSSIDINGLLLCKKTRTVDPNGFVRGPHVPTYHCEEIQNARTFLRFLLHKNSLKILRLIYARFTPGAVNKPSCPFIDYR